MPRVNVPATVVTRDGVEPPAEVTGDTTNNHFVYNDGRTVLLVRNSGASGHTLTVNIKRTVDGQTAEARTVAVPASESRYVGPFPVADYGDQVEVDVDHAELLLTALRVD